MRCILYIYCLTYISVFVLVFFSLLVRNEEEKMSLKRLILASHWIIYPSLFRPIQFLCNRFENHRCDILFYACITIHVRHDLQCKQKHYRALGRHQRAGEMIGSHSDNSFSAILVLFFSIFTMVVCRRASLLPKYVMNVLKTDGSILYNWFLMYGQLTLGSPEWYQMITVDKVQGIMCST